MNESLEAGHGLGPAAGGMDLLGASLGGIDLLDGEMGISGDLGDLLEMTDVLVDDAPAVRRL